MIRAFRVFWLLGVLLVFFLLWSVGTFARKGLPKSPVGNLEGRWVFERVEYIERVHPDQDYQVKYTIEEEQNLELLIPCYPQIIKKIMFYDENFVALSCLVETYFGSYHVPFARPSSFGEPVLIVFGDSDRIGEKMPAEGMIYNAPTMNYLIEFIDSNTIGITIKGICFDHSAPTEGVVRSILKRE
ncbi:MAG: hypothetical protein LBH77_06910 [Tannerella sp.]|jgi:hypothetical protein|nr:hypothetical protein [Tannerella sp.]